MRPNYGVMLANRARRWYNITPKLDERAMFAAWIHCEDGIAVANEMK